MKCIRISAMGCMSCIYMKDQTDEILSQYELDLEERDADFDDLSDLNFKKLYPALLFYKDGDLVQSFNGEYDLEALNDFLKEMFYEK